MWKSHGKKKEKAKKGNVRLRQSKSSARRWQVGIALPVCVQHLSNWKYSQAEEMSAHIRVLCGALGFVTRKFMKGLHSNFLRWDN